MQIPEKYSPYFTNLDTPSVIADNDLKIVWKNKATDSLMFHIRKGTSVRYYLSKQEFSRLKRLKPGEYMYLTFLLDEPTNGFCKRKDDCFIFRISRFNAAAHKRIRELFDVRYSNYASVASSLPDSAEPHPLITRKRMDRLAGIFEGLYIEGNERRETSAPLALFAKQATYALAGINVNYISDSITIFADINVHDLYMALSAMAVCLISFTPGIKDIILEREMLETDTVIKMSCSGTGFAANLADVYKNKEKLDMLCEYGAQYLNLLLINVICDNYGWEFNAVEEDGNTVLSLTISVIWDNKSRIALYDGDMKDEIIDTLLLPFRTN